MTFFLVWSFPVKVNMKFGGSAHFFFFDVFFVLLVSGAKDVVSFQLANKREHSRITSDNKVDTTHSQQRKKKERDTKTQIHVELEIQ